MRTTIRPMQTARRRDRNGPGEPDCGPGRKEGETITGGPWKPLEFMDILNRDARAVSLGGAVSGAARVVMSQPRAGSGQGQDISLSDGSRISFTSVNHNDLLLDA